jgi:hypothetical protein
MVTDAELFEMLTTNPAKIWSLLKYGALEKGYCAYIVIARKSNGNSSLESFYNVNPEGILMVMHKGQISLFDESIKPQLEKTGIDFRGYSKVILNKQTKYVSGNLPELIKSIQAYYPEAKFPVEIA